VQVSGEMDQQPGPGSAIRVQQVQPGRLAGPGRGAGPTEVPRSGRHVRAPTRVRRIHRSGPVIGSTGRSTRVRIRSRSTARPDRSADRFACPSPCPGSCGGFLSSAGSSARPRGRQRAVAAATAWVPGVRRPGSASAVHSGSSATTGASPGGVVVSGLGGTVSLSVLLPAARPGRGDPAGRCGSGGRPDGEWGGAAPARFRPGGCRRHRTVPLPRAFRVRCDKPTTERYVARTSRTSYSEAW
jgi:hypothetical protein